MRNEILSLSDNELDAIDQLLLDVASRGVLSDNNIVTKCAEYSITDIRALEIKSMLLEHNAVRQHANTLVIARNENSSKYGTISYFRKCKEELIKTKDREAKKDEETDLNIKHLKQSLILSRLAILISGLALIISALAYYK